MKRRKVSKPADTDAPVQTDAYSAEEARTIQGVIRSLLSAEYRRAMEEYELTDDPYVEGKAAGLKYALEIVRRIR